MVESEIAKAVTRLIKRADKLVQEFQKNTAEAKAVVEELKKFLKKGD